MKNYILITSLFFFTSLACWSQNNDSNSVKLDLLKAPSSPASNLLGFAPSDIEKPTDVSAFMLSLQSATSSFTKLPGNYAVDIAPFWLLSKKRDYTTASLNSRDKGDIFRQTFIFSTAIKNPDSLDKNLNANNTYAGFGFKFSILRGDYDDETKNTLNKIGLIQKNINNVIIDTIQVFMKTDPEMKSLLAKKENFIKAMLKEGLKMEDIKNTQTFKDNQDAIESLTGALKESIKSKENLKTYLKDLRKLAEGFIISREGWSWDFAGGLSGEFIKKRFNDSRMFNAGAWTTFGYTGKKGGSFLGIVRYLYNPDRIFAKDNSPNKIGNISTLDAGARYVYSNLNARFNFSFEGIYRSVLSSNTIDPSWRFVLNAEYSIWSNQKLTFSFGKNFDGTITKDGNLIAALSFLTGFGNKR